MVVIVIVLEVGINQIVVTSSQTHASRTNILSTGDERVVIFSIGLPINRVIRSIQDLFQIRI